MMLQRSPHPGFACVWIAWFMLVSTAHVQPSHPWLGFWVLVALLPVEVAGKLFDHRLADVRETLSGVVAWAMRGSKKPTAASGAWIALVLLLALSASTLFYRTMISLADLPGLAAGSMCVALTAVLVIHWLERSGNG